MEELRAGAGADLGLSTAAEVPSAAKQKTGTCVISASGNRGWKETGAGAVAAPCGHDGVAMAPRHRRGATTRKNGEKNGVKTVQNGPKTIENGPKTSENDPETLQNGRRYAARAPTIVCPQP